MENKDKEIVDKGRKVAEDISSMMMGREVMTNHLQEWFEENEFSQEVIEKLSNEKQLSKLCDEFKTDKSVPVERLRKEISRKNRRRLFIKTTAFSAVAAAIAVISFLLIDNSDSVIVREEVKMEIISEVPNNKPLLILDNGQNVDLSSNTTSVVGHAEVSGDSLTYSIGTQVEENQQPSFNTLVLPEKNSYVVTLSDGTIVYLNSNSTLKYPTHFSGDSREVILTGEAYFEVEKNLKKPFVVIVNSARVTVYGTKFNINSYNPQFIKTSLISGSIGVTLEGEDEIIIKPGLMLLSDNKIGKSVVVKANTYKYEAWKRGFFRCDDEEISTLLEDISAWYGVRFEYEFVESRKMKISASINRKISIEDVIELLSATSEVKFKKKGENVYSVR